ncbi:MAG: DUF1156 domain-containing protein [Planctomycetes bacterium]|nr:DUF1156 domain-containing protein [Planctomycetota bacterium]
MTRPHSTSTAGPANPQPPGQETIFANLGVKGLVEPGLDVAGVSAAAVRTAQGAPGGEWEPTNLGKALALQTVDFSDPNRPKTCLEVDFPILPINQLAQVEGNAGKPIYQMSKWFARRRSSVFRALMIAAATKAPDEAVQASKLVWDAYYANHQKAGTFRNFKVLEPFMGGGTTLVEGNRLGFHVSGCDLSPIAWFVCKNELSAADPTAVKRLFDHIEATVKPQIQPFYATTCPRGHRGRWLDASTGAEAAGVDPIALPPEQRARYRWAGPEIIYTFWAKHGHCRKTDCGHRTPIMADPIVAVKELSAQTIPTTCPHCRHTFRVFLGETRMAPGCQRVDAPNERNNAGVPLYTETTKRFADLVYAYGKDGMEETVATAEALVHAIADERGFACPACHCQAGAAFKAIVEDHLQPRPTKSGKSRQVKSAFDRRKLGLVKQTVAMTLCVDPRWMKGSPGRVDGALAGGTVTSTDVENAAWYRTRQQGLRLIEVRGAVTAETVVTMADGTTLAVGKGNVPGQAEFTCGHCGAQQGTLESLQETGRSPAIVAYALQCHCPECDSSGQVYGGRYFKAPDFADVGRLISAEHEWSLRSTLDLTDYWPKSEIVRAYMTHVRQPLPQHGYTHWWTMFNPRQRLGHAALLRAITEAPPTEFPLAVREQALGAFQQYLRNQNMFSFWNPQRDSLEPMFSNPNYHPKGSVIENAFFHKLGRGNWTACLEGVIEGVEWLRTTWEAAVDPDGERHRVPTGDVVDAARSAIINGSSTDLSGLGSDQYDLVITDPPFGKNVFYADLADFFFVWLQIPLSRWYVGTPQALPWVADRTPHAAEAVPNPIETPDDREEWQSKPTIPKRLLGKIRTESGQDFLEAGMTNPCLVEEPCERRYREMLAEVWTECGRRLKPGGLMAFTFHHSEDEPWVDVLQALFEAGFVLIATYPVRSDETKGDNAAFGAKKIEYDIVHVCRRRLEEPQPVAYLKMRAWVKEEAGRLKDLLGDSHRAYAEDGLPESDLRIILIGKSLEFYSRHYGQVLTGSGQVLGVRDALLGVNQLIDDMLMTETGRIVPKPPDEAEPATRLFLKMFGLHQESEKNDGFKVMRGTGYDFKEFEGLGWAKIESGTIKRTELPAIFNILRARNRKVLRRDLDQALFCAGCCLPGSTYDLTVELDATRAARQWTVKRAVLPILRWMATHDPVTITKEAARTAATLVEAWWSRPVLRDRDHQLSIFELLDSEAAGGAS